MEGWSCRPPDRLLDTHMRVAAGTVCPLTQVTPLRMRSAGEQLVQPAGRCLVTTEKQRRWPLLSTAEQCHCAEGGNTSTGLQGDGNKGQNNTTRDTWVLSFICDTNHEP